MRLFLGVAGGAADDEAGLDDAFLGVVVGQGALDQADEDVGGFLAYLAAALLHGREHRVTHRGAETVGEAADAHLVGDREPHALDHRQDADGGLVVDGEEGVGTILHVHHCRRNALGISAVVADAYQRLIHLQAMLVQGIAVAVKAVFGNHHAHGGAVEGDSPATSLDEV